MKIDRQMGIISHLVNKRKTTAKELSELFKVSTRTIMRDIDDLSLAGIPLYVMKGKNGGIFLMEDFQTDKPPLTQSERLSIESGLKSRYQVLEDSSTFNAILKLNATNTYSDFEIDLSLSQGNLEIRTLIFKLLEAIRSRVKIKFSYINSQGLVSQKHCEPYRIVYKDRSWYMDAYDTEKERFSVYKVARISELTLSDTFSKRHFTPLPYDGGTWMNENKVPVILHVQKIVLDRFVELLGYNAIKPITSDIYEITYPLHDNDWGYNTLLAFGKYITVISPKHFLKHFTNYIDTIHKQYPN
ncbi:HTH domain protein [Streptococcus mitis bv. 2 str. SK95]|uniref:HTH domain protein n=1 Tax=Streptococcus mitis bv. 2 str. SK95 TaxID=1000588 RepID=F9LVB4_STROR|nr:MULTISPECIES: YafY family protein [Streptococcus]EGU69431.1 HTH domain protein [Streptococcus mitis bv. 2 str. SK95]MDU5072416.1 YafY family protein [Streptococcus sp.]